MPPMAGVKCTLLGAPDQTPASPALGHLLRDQLEGRNRTGSTRALRLPDGTGAAWYILIIIGIYAVVFLFRMASNILRKNDKSLEDIYFSNLTSELKEGPPRPGNQVPHADSCQQSHPAAQPGQPGAQACDQRDPN